MKAELIKVRYGEQLECSGPHCKRPSEYMVFQGFGHGPPWHIKPGTTAVLITLFGHHWTYDPKYIIEYDGSGSEIPQTYQQDGIRAQEYFCPGCCKEALDSLKIFLDPSLWIYH
jgi:hypothetical protein